MNYKMRLKICLLLLTMLSFTLPGGANIPPPTDTPPPPETSASQQGSSVNRGEEQSQSSVEQDFLETEQQIRDVERQMEGRDFLGGTENGKKIEEANTLANQIYQDQQKEQSQRSEVIQETQTKVFEIQQDVTVNRARNESASEARWNDHINR